MGAWWVSQFDPSREVAEAAQRSFQVCQLGDIHVEHSEHTNYIFHLACRCRMFPITSPYFSVYHYRIEIFDFIYRWPCLPLLCLCVFPMELQATFPDRKKRVDALIYCLKDIMAHVDDNLNLSPQMLIEMGTLSEEVAEKLERVSFINLHFLCYVI